jgi:anionic cell wall polymer biosynthesis LytR-Cps2A-Psr (LCP) family protein
VSFASSITLSRAGYGQTLASEIGATAGAAIPALAQLDTTPVAEAIRGQRAVNVLLLGYGGTGHDGAYLTDSMLVVHLDFQTGRTTLISIPRDLWVQVPTDGTNGSHWKINAAYELGLDSRGYPNKLPQFTGASGGGSMAEYVVSQVTGLQIDYFVAVDFSGFQQVVDTLGGVDVNVANTFTDYSYPTSDATADGPACTGDDQSTGCRYMVVHFDAGEQHMDGATALTFARSRHSADNGEGSDFARSARQQKVLVAAEQKADSLGILPKIFTLMDNVQGHVTTDLSVPEIQDLAQYLEKNSLGTATHVGLTSGNLLASGTSADGQYVLTPRLGQDDYTDVQAYIQQQIQNGNASAATATPVQD